MSQLGQADLARVLPDSLVGDLIGVISSATDNTGRG